MKNYYKDLGFSKEEFDKGITPRAIKKRYYQMSLKFHPDKNPDDPQSEEKFKVIQAAYDFLKDPEKGITAADLKK